MKKLVLSSLIAILSAPLFVTGPNSLVAYADIQQAVQDVLDADAEMKTEEYERRLEDPLYPGDLISRVPTYDDSYEASVPSDENCIPEDSEDKLAANQILSRG